MTPDPTYVDEHVAYELVQAAHCALRLAAGIEDACTRNTFLEGFLLHIRGLIEFVGYGPKEGYVRARDFLPAWSDTIPRTLAHRINSEIVHLTSGRKASHDVTRSWHLSDYRIVFEEAVRFYEVLGKRPPSIVAEVLSAPQAAKMDALLIGAYSTSSLGLVTLHPDDLL